MERESARLCAMFISSDSPLHAFAFEGHHNGVKFVCRPASYAKGKMQLQYEKDDKSDILKGPSGRLLDALNARYSHRSGYILAPSRAVQWRDLFVAGWDAEIDWRGCYGSKKSPLFESPDGRKMPLKDALAELKRAKEQAA
jgi:hypothetical protein